jgi:hypothetical protein
MKAIIALAVVFTVSFASVSEASVAVRITGTEAIKAFNAMTSQGVKELQSQSALAKTGPNIQCVIKFDTKNGKINLLEKGSRCVIKVNCSGVASQVNDEDDESCEQE